MNRGQKLIGTFNQNDQGFVEVLKKSRECLFRDYLTGMRQVVRIVFLMAMKLLTFIKKITKEAGSDIESIDGKHKYFIYL